MPPVRCVGERLGLLSAARVAAERSVCLYIQQAQCQSLRDCP
jgi:hypothetical protein